MVIISHDVKLVPRARGGGGGDWAGSVVGQPLLRHRDAQDDGVATAVSVVYLTMAPTFTGAIASYSTDLSGTRSPDSGAAAAAAASAAASTPAAISQADVDTSNQQQSQQQQQQQQTTQQQPAPTTEQAQPQPTTQESTTEQPATTSEPTTSSQDTSTESTPTSFTPQYMPTDSTSAAMAEESSAFPSTTSQEKTGGMTGGAKAGLAIGLVILISLIAGAIFIFLKYRKNWKGDKFDDEKSFVSPGPPPNKPPRLSFGQLGFGSRNAAQPPMQQNPGMVQRGNDSRLTMFPAAPVAHATTNPFGRQSPGPAGNAPIPVDSNRANNTSNPFADSNALQPPSNEQVQGAAAAVAAGRNSAMSSTSNVHRVQLNFQPTMDDELELYTGQVVRILHEYDDGWALCMRMDRSKQGVVPRTCLSKNPIKPRNNQPPPLRPNGRPMSSANSINSNDTSSPPATSGLNQQQMAHRSEYPATIAPTPTWNKNRRSSSMGTWGRPPSLPQPPADLQQNPGAWAKVPARKPLAGSAR